MAKKALRIEQIEAWDDLARALAPFHSVRSTVGFILAFGEEDGLRRAHAALWPRVAHFAPALPPHGPAMLVVRESAVADLEAAFRRLALPFETRREFMPWPRARWLVAMRRRHVARRARSPWWRHLAATGRLAPLADRAVGTSDPGAGAPAAHGHGRLPPADVTTGGPDGEPCRRP